MIHKFTQHDGVPAEPPADPVFDLYRKCAAGQRLTREEKDRVARTLWGLFGANSGEYKRAGWSAPFFTVLPRILVRHYHGGQFFAYRAPDKTSLRKALNSRGDRIDEMILA